VVLRFILQTAGSGRTGGLLCRMTTSAVGRIDYRKVYAFKKGSHIILKPTGSHNKRNDYFHGLKTKPCHMRTLLVAFFLLIMVKAFPAFDDHFAFKTLRLDYFRTGNHETEIISIDELIEEPYWGGSKTNLIDVFDYGHHKFEV
jgi:hypothetical protein